MIVLAIAVCMLVCITLVASHTLHERQIANIKFKTYHIAQFLGASPSRVRQSAPSTSPLAPDNIKQAYGYPTDSNAGSGQTIAIIAAYSQPNIENDLAIFSNTFNLPACTVASGCLTIVNQTGGSQLPRADLSWSREISLDIQWAHAIAPGAKLLLVEAKSEAALDLIIASQYASQHAKYVSMSFGTEEFVNQNAFDNIFTTAGVSYFAASGDVGAVPQYPSTSVNVIAVGGTTLNFVNGQFSSETGWQGSGGGCSTQSSAPTGQNTGSVNCNGKRAVPDIASNADPNSGVFVYDSYGCTSTPDKCWYQYGGTSLACPVIAARASHSGNQFNVAGLYDGSYGVHFRDITVGMSSGNGNTHSCLVGYDLVTGLGSWDDAISSNKSSASSTTQPTNKRVNPFQINLYV